MNTDEILAVIDTALVDHGRKTFVEMSDFMDILLDIRAIAALDTTLN